MKNAVKRISAIVLAGLTVALVGCSNSAVTNIETNTETNSETNTLNSSLTGAKTISVKGTVTKEENTKSESSENDILLGYESTVTEDEKFGSATVNLSLEDMENAGFHLGDSCDILFGNGYKIEDVPFFNGYYVKNGEPVIVAYPGYSTISITYNNKGIWDIAELVENETVDIELNTAQKYSAIQEALGQIYSFIRDDYPSDVAFCNFRSLVGGKLKENLFYRGASPVDNSRGRAAYTDALLKANNIAFVMDLADSMDNITKYMAGSDFASAYTKELIENNQIALLDMGSAYTSLVYKQKVVTGLREMLNAQGPVYIHCMEGKDRTGFVCALVEALAGASYEEMLTDYMTTYTNYYKVSKEASPEKYNAIADLYFDAFIECLHGSLDKTANYVEDAKNYLKEGGMTEDEIAALIEFITE